MKHTRKKGLKTVLKQQAKAHNKCNNAILPLAAMMLMPLSAFVNAEDSVAPTATAELETINVTANKKAKNSYKAEATRVGKVLQKPIDVPQAVTIVKTQMLDEQGVSSFKDAMKNVAGLTFNAAEGGRSGDNMMLRGFYTFGDMYLDGIRDTAQYNRETFNLEQIDVLRGSAAMLFGRGQAGGVFNQVSKVALLEDAYEVEGAGGPRSSYRLNADLNKVLGKTSAVRLNLMTKDETSWRVNPSLDARPEIRRDGVHLTASTGIGTKNLWTASYLEMRAKDIPDYGISFDTATRRPTKKFPVSDYWGVDGNFDDAKNRVATILNHYRFSPNVHLRTQIRDANYDRSYWAVAPNNNTAPTPTVPAGGANKVRQTDVHNLAAQSDLTAKLMWGSVKHELLGGVEYLGEKSDRNGLKNIGTAQNAYFERDVFSTAPTISYKGKTLAFYGQDNIHLTQKWSVLGGIRFDHLKADYTAFPNENLNYKEQSWRAGVSYKPTPVLHYYLSYSDAFSPTADLYQLSGNAFPAERSDTAELGVKWDLFDGDLSLRSALFRTTKHWERNTDLEAPPANAILTRKRRTTGIEFEATGNITEQWQVFSGLSFMDPKIIEAAENRDNAGKITYADPRFNGQTARNTAKHSFNLWTTYNVTDRWKVGGGVEAKSKRYGYNPTVANAGALFTSDGTFNPNTAPGFMIANAMVEYTYKKFSAQVNVKNLFNTVYFEDVYDQGGFTNPGNKRYPMLTLKYKY